MNTNEKKMQKFDIEIVQKRSCVKEIFGINYEIFFHLFWKYLDIYLHMYNKQKTKKNHSIVKYARSHERNQRKKMEKYAKIFKNRTKVERKERCNWYEGKKILMISYDLGL